MHWSKRGFSEWAMKNGDFFAAFKIKQPPKKPTSTDESFEDMRKKSIERDESFETMSRGKLSNSDFLKMVHPARVVAVLILIMGTKRGVDFIVN